MDRAIENATAAIISGQELSSAEIEYFHSELYVIKRYCYLKLGETLEKSKGS